MHSETLGVERLGFGRRFTGHMASARYSSGGWSDVEVGPFGDLPLSPAAMVFHYGQAVFEGLKAFRRPSGGSALFRPSAHAERLNQSARRLAMPELPAGMFVDACRQLVGADQDAVPSGRGQSLYLRPMMIATEPALGVRPADEYLFVIIASPVDSYFGPALDPLEVWAVEDQVRAAPFGTGAAKCAGNYAAGLEAKREAGRRGCDEVLWLDAVHRRLVEELGGMNIVLVTGGGAPQLVTPPLTDTILDGVTRRSLLELAARLGHGTVERPVAIEELCGGSGFTEAFACGTAAVVAPIGAVHWRGRRWAVGGGTAGPVTSRLRDALTAIQEGRGQDPFGWMLDA